MALHFSATEFAKRMERLQAAMDERKLDCMLLFAQESMYWLTGYDTFGFCFFQCLVVKRSGEMVLLTRAPDLRQARHTSNIENVVIWTDREGADPTVDLHKLLGELDLVGTRIGIEYSTAGLNGRRTRALDARLKAFAETEDASDLVEKLRMVKSSAEISHIRKAGELADDALDAAIELAGPGANEAEILSAMQAAVLSKGGDYPGNPFIIGSGKDALLCRYKSGRRKLSKNDQLTLEWAGVWAQYHAAMMRTVIVGKPTARHLELYEAASAALVAVRDTMVVGNTLSDMFAAHARVLDDAGLVRHRLNACGYSMGASYAPCWMDRPMIYDGNTTVIEKNMVLFLHMIIADSETNTAMTLGQSYIATASGADSVSRHEIDLIVR
jgi:Xaa-Pro dipeptidase